MFFSIPEPFHAKQPLAVFTFLGSFLPAPNDISQKGGGDCRKQDDMWTSLLPGAYGNDFTGPRRLCGPAPRVNVQWPDFSSSRRGSGSHQYPLIREPSISFDVQFFLQMWQCDFFFPDFIKFKAVFFKQS